MSQAIIDALLESGMHALADGGVVVWPNIPPKMPPKTPLYFEMFIIPATPQVYDLAQNATIFRGSWQINVVVPPDNGVTTARAMANVLAAKLTPNYSLTDPTSGLTVYLNGAVGVFAGIQSDDAYIIPLSVDYRADVLINVN